MKFKTNLILNPTPVNPVIDTHLLFDENYSEKVISPIDEFSNRLRELNKISPHPSDFETIQGQLILLGVVAAVESYIRTLFRKAIILDPICQEKTYDKELSLGAALHLTVDKLPEAILEKINFISKRNIEEALRDYMGVSGAFPPALALAVNSYVEVCHLRHCTVHRFGKLGASNAIFLGLSKHKNLLEKPMNLSYKALQDAIAVSNNFVKTLNNFLFNEFLSRLPLEGWTENYTKDKKLFLSYYSIFSGAPSSQQEFDKAKIVYKKFISELSKFRKGS